MAVNALNEIIGYFGTFGGDFQSANLSEALSFAENLPDMPAAHLGQTAFAPSGQGFSNLPHDSLLARNFGIDPLHASSHHDTLRENNYREKLDNMSATGRAASIVAFSGQNSMRIDYEALRQKVEDANLSTQEERELTSLLARAERARENGNLEKERELHQEFSEQFKHLTETGEVLEHTGAEAQKTAYGLRNEVVESLGKLKEFIKDESSDISLDDLKKDLNAANNELSQKLDELENSIKAHEESINAFQKELDFMMDTSLNPLNLGTPLGNGFENIDLASLQANINTQRQQLEDLKEQYDQLDEYSQQLDAVLTSEGQLDFDATRKAIENDHVSADEWAEMTADIQDTATLANLEAFLNNQMGVKVDRPADTNDTYDDPVLTLENELFSNNDGMSPDADSNQTNTGSAAETYNPSDSLFQYSPIQLSSVFKQAHDDVAKGPEQPVQPASEPDLVLG